MLVLNLPFKALMFLTLMRPSLVLFLVLWLKLVKDFLKVRCRLALLPFLISCLIWLDLVASLPLIKERILVIILLLHFLSLMLGSVLVLMLRSEERRVGKECRSRWSPYEIGLGIPADALLLFLGLLPKLVKDVLKVRCRLALLPFLIRCLSWWEKMAGLLLMNDRVLVSILRLERLIIVLRSVLVQRR